jgi:hypothetical protein
MNAKGLVEQVKRESSHFGGRNPGELAQSLR